MKILLINFIFVAIFLNLTWGVYVPELTRNNAKVNGRDNVQTLNKLSNNNDFDDNNVNDDGQNIFYTARQALTNAHQLSHTPRQQKSYDIVDDVVLSEKNHTSKVFENLGAQPTGLAEQQHKLHNNDVVNEINEEYGNYNTLQHSRQRRQLSDLLIAPNTYWCGRGNTANGTYNHLGGASMADKCCRTHDHCKVYIPAMSNRYDLFNFRPYTLSHCTCDRRFRMCLKMANDEDATTIGKLFFNLVQTHCFVLIKEVVCEQPSNNGSCIKKHINQKAHLKKNKKY